MSIQSTTIRRLASRGIVTDDTAVVNDMLPPCKPLDHQKQMAKMWALIRIMACLTPREREEAVCYP